MATEEIEIPKPILIAIKDLKLDKNNVKVHTDTQIESLMAVIKFGRGFTDPVIIDKNNNVLAGKGSVLAATKLGMKKVPCLYLDKSEKELQAFMLMDNRVNESTWDKEEVKAILDNIKFNFEKYHMTFDEFKLEPEANVKDVSFQATKHHCPKCGYDF